MCWERGKNVETGAGFVLMKKKGCREMNETTEGQI